MANYHGGFLLSMEKSAEDAAVCREKDAGCLVPDQGPTGWSADKSDIFVFLNDGLNASVPQIWSLDIM